MKFIEDLGVLFKGDPTFDYIFRELPKGCFERIVELRRKRSNSEPQLPDL